MQSRGQPTTTGPKVSEILMLTAWVIIIGVEVSIAIARGRPNIVEALVVVAGILGIARVLRIWNARRRP